jgi:hypothetical protein
MKAWLKTIVVPSVTLGLMCALAATGAVAQTAPAPAAPAPAAPAAEPPPQILGFDFTGYADVGFTDFTTGKGTFSNRGHARVFDWENGAVSVQNIDLQLQKAPEAGFGGLIDFSIGKDADTLHSYGTVNKDKGPYGADVAADGTKPAQTYFDPTQLYGTYTKGAFSVLFGKYATHAGQEVIKSRDDSNFSRSILFGYAIPFTHTGARASYKASDTLTLMLGANEGWDTITDKNGGSTAEFDWEWSPSKAFSFFGTYLNGQERITSYPQTAYDASKKGTRSLIDLIFTYNASDALQFVLNYDSGSQDKVDLSGIGKSTSASATWSGAALYANYTVNDDWRVSARGESFSDADGYRTGVIESGKTKGPTWTEFTATVAYMAIKKTEIRVELRSDAADQKIFSDAKGEKAIDSMMSLGLEAIYKF